MGILPTSGSPAFPCHPMSGFLSAGSTSPSAISAAAAATAAAAALYGSTGAAALFPSFCMQVKHLPYNHEKNIF
jgi:hypothetical protein